MIFQAGLKCWRYIILQKKIQIIGMALAIPMKGNLGHGTALELLKLILVSPSHWNCTCMRFPRSVEIESGSSMSLYAVLRSFACFPIFQRMISSGLNLPNSSKGRVDFKVQPRIHRNIFRTSEASRILRIYYCIIFNF